MSYIVISKLLVCSLRNIIRLATHKTFLNLIVQILMLIHLTYHTLLHLLDSTCLYWRYVILWNLFWNIWYSDATFRDKFRFILFLKKIVIEKLISLTIKREISCCLQILLMDNFSWNFWSYLFLTVYTGKRICFIWNFIRFSKWIKCCMGLVFWLVFF